MNQENSVDIFDMSDEEFTTQYGTSDSGSLVQPNEVESMDNVDSTTIESEESEEIQESFEEEETEEELEEETNDEASDLSESEEEVSDESSDEGSTDFKTEYTKLIGTPIKGAGREITLQNADEALRLIQMGMGYHKRMEQMKPAQKLISMLESNDMLDESKLSYAIDLLNKNPQAISKLVAESGIDTYAMDEEQVKQYKPTDYSVSDKQFAVDNALKEISSTPTYAKTVQVLGNEWDNASREIIMSNPSAISIINDHMASGLFETVSNEVERLRMLGSLPSGMSNIEAYKYVGDSLYANQTMTAPDVQTGQQHDFEQANVKPPIKKPKRETVISQKRATQTPNSRSSASKRNSVEDVFNMSDDEFIKKYGSNLY